MKWRISLGIRLLAFFFAFGALMCALTIVMLLSPGSALDRLWKLNPEAYSSFQAIGGLSILLMGVVGAACAAAAIGLARNTNWGRWLAVVVLAINLVGDLGNALLRHDYRSLFGLPIGGAMIFYLARRGKTDTPSPR